MAALSLRLRRHPRHVASIDPAASAEQAKILFTTTPCRKALPPQYLMATIININQVPISQREAHGLVPPVGRGKTDAKERLLAAAVRQVERLVSLKNQRRRMSKRALDPALNDCLALRASIWLCKAR